MHQSSPPVLLRQLVLLRGAATAAARATTNPSCSSPLPSPLTAARSYHATIQRASTAAAEEATSSTPAALPITAARRSISTSAIVAARSTPVGGPAPQAARAALEYCAQLVRQHDPDNFAWAMMLPKEERARVLALRALNVETLLVPTSAGRRSAGDEAAAMLRIRYQWWRDAVRAAMDAPRRVEEAGSGSDREEEQEEKQQQQQQQGAAASSTATRRPPPPPPAHPVVTALWAARASAGPRLQRYPLRRLIDAREREAVAAALSEPAPRSIADLEEHGEATHSQLLYAQMAAVLGREDGDEDEDEASSAASSARDHAASHAGKAVALAMALRGAPYAAARRRCALPLETLAEAGLSQEDLFRRAAAVEKGEAGAGWSAEQDAALRDAVLAVASTAVGHLREARALAEERAGRGRWAHALLPAVAADCYLSALEKTAQFDVFHPELRPPTLPAPSGGAGAGGGAPASQPPLPPLGAGLGVSPPRYLLTLRWRAWRGTF